MIHKFEKDGKFYVLDVESLSFFEVDAPAYELLEEDHLKEPKGLGDEYKQAHKELKTLIDQGLLYTPALEVPVRERALKALCLHMAHDCNLSCRYCFAGQGTYGTGGIMDIETAKKAIDLVSKTPRRSVEIDFFGGEPLLNLEAIKEVVAYCEGIDKDFHFTLTTNGVLLDKDADWIDETMDNVVLSVDGRRQVNDRMRKTKSGGGSYDVIMPKFKDFVKNRDKDYYVRATFTRKNLDFSEDVKHLAGEGFRHLSCEPVVTQDPELAIREEDLDKIKDQYDEIARLVEEDELDFFHFNIDLDAGPCLQKLVSGCGAGVDYLAVAPDGKLYPCHQFVGEDEFVIGNVDEGITNPALQELFYNAVLGNKEGCSECWNKYFCSGGCHAAAYHKNGDVLKPDALFCEMQKKRTENALTLLNFD